MVAVGPERGLWRRERRALKSAFGATSPNCRDADDSLAALGNRLIRHVRQHYTLVCLPQKAQIDRSKSWQTARGEPKW